MAAANATKAAASSVQFTCCTPISTSGLLQLLEPFTVDDVTNPLYMNCEKSPAPISDPDHDPDPDPDPDPKSQLLCGLHAGVDTLLVVSIMNLPPFLVLMTELTRVVVLGVAVTVSCTNSKR